MLLEQIEAKQREAQITNLQEEVRAKQRSIVELSQRLQKLEERLKKVKPMKAPATTVTIASLKDAAAVAVPSTKDMEAKTVGIRLTPALRARVDSIAKMEKMPSVKTTICALLQCAVDMFPNPEETTTHA